MAHYGEHRDELAEDGEPDDPEPPKRSSGPRSGRGHTYANSDAARAAGAARIRRGTPDYDATPLRAQREPIDVGAEIIGLRRLDCLDAFLLAAVD
jgi:hypothetical protein